MKDDYSLEVAQETGIFFIYAGKNSWDMSRFELVKALIETEERYRSHLESQRESYSMLKNAYSGNKNRGFLARLFRF